MLPASTIQTDLQNNTNEHKNRNHNITLSEFNTICSSHLLRQTHCALLYDSYNLFASGSNPDRKPGCHYPGLLECVVTHLGRWVPALWSSLLPPSSRYNVALYADSRRLLATEQEMVPARHAIDARAQTS